MWQHDIISDITKSDKTKDASIFVDLVKKSTAFHFGDVKGLYSLCKIANKANQPWFLSGPTVNRLPYKVCLFEYLDTMIGSGTTNVIDTLYGPGSEQLKDDVKKIEKINTNGRCALLASEFGENKLFIQSATWTTISKTWTIFPTVFMVGIGHDLSEDFGTILPGKGNIHMSFRDTPGGKQLSQLGGAGNMAAWDVPFLAMFLMALNCKNVCTETINPSEKLNKKRKRTGKQELISYNVLKVRPFLVDRKNRTGYLGDPLDHNRLHFCRGHFKQYDQTKPLFGKLSGLYWWEAHLRGKNRDGVILKDYEVSDCTPINTVE